MLNEQKYKKCKTYNEQKSHHKGVSPMNYIYSWTLWIVTPTNLQIIEDYLTTIIQILDGSLTIIQTFNFYII